MSSVRVSFVPQILLGLVGAGALYIGFTLPPRAATLPPVTPDVRVVYGSYHIHTKRSDGTGTPDTIAAAAARAGLQFVILTDHGNATRPPDPPQYLHGVLTIDAVEISTADGHVVALGLSSAAPFPLAGEGRDVIEDVHRLGGWTVIAHPDSPKPDLRWRTWNVPYDAIEWLNIDSEWRDETPAHLAGTALRYFVRGPETIASLFQRPAQTLRRWDAAARFRAVTGLAAVDAHARLPWRTRHEGVQGDTLVALPSYVQTFRTIAQAAILDRPLSGDASIDSRLVLSALRAGRAFSAVTAYGAPAALTFVATQNGATAQMGGYLHIGAPASFQSIVNDPAARVALLHNGAQVAAGRGQVDFTGEVSAGGYRIEAFRSGTSVPWVVSNPIYGGEPDGAEDIAVFVPPPVRLVPLPGAPGWHIEKSASSTGTVAAEGAATRFSFALGPGAPLDQFAAVVGDLGDLSTEGFDRVQFTVRADRPTRFSVQLRLPGRGGARWRHSVYADDTPRQVVAHLQDFQPADRPTSQRPIVAHVRSVLFVVDTLNNVPSSRGTIWLSDLALGVGQAER